MVLGEDNFVNRTIGAAAQAGVHAGITAAAVRSGGASAMFGVGYGGWATLNAIRSGNNYGPF
jgi:Zn-dependent alcohol dehydrogenase